MYACGFSYCPPLSNTLGRPQPPPVLPLQLFKMDGRAVLEGYLHRFSASNSERPGWAGLLTYRVGRPLEGQADVLRDIVAGLAKDADWFASRAQRAWSWWRS